MEQIKSGVSISEKSLLSITKQPGFYIKYKDGRLHGETKQIFTLTFFSWLDIFHYIDWVILTFLAVIFFCFSRFELCKKCPYSEFLWSVYSHIQTEYRDLSSKSSYSSQVKENTAQKNSEYGHFLLRIELSVSYSFLYTLMCKVSCDRHWVAKSFPDHHLV